VLGRAVLRNLSERFFSGADVLEGDFASDSEFFK
jgi:hypothetical protein